MYGYTNFSPKRIRAVILDFDGLIVETESCYIATWQEIFESHGAAFPIERFQQAVGLSYKQFDPYQMLQGKIINVSREEMMEQFREIYGFKVESRPLLPGVCELLMESRIHNLAIGLASNGSRPWVEKCLEKTGLMPFFSAVKCVEDIQNPKPDPEIYVQVLRELDVTASEAIAFEDSFNGVMAAKKAGLFCIAVPTESTATHSFDHADLVSSSLKDHKLVDFIRMAESPAVSDEQ